MKDAVIREWSCSDHEAIQRLLSFLMEFVVSHANSQVIIKEALFGFDL